MRAEEFAARLQASFDAAFGSGTSVVKSLGPSPDDVKQAVFEVMVAPPMGCAFGVHAKSLEQEIAPEGIAMLAYQVSRDMVEVMQQSANALMIAAPETFMPDAEVEAVQEVLAEANAPVEGVFLAQKRPVTVEAMLFDGTNAETHAVYQWVESNTQGSYDYLGDERPEHGVSIDPADGAMVIHTLEGEMKVSRGDYVIRGVQGEFYPCKPDIFEATYQRVDELPDDTEAESDVEELRALLEQALAERDEARAALNDLQSVKEVSE